MLPLTQGAIVELANGKKAFITCVKNTVAHGFTYMEDCDGYPEARSAKPMDWDAKSGTAIHQNPGLNVRRPMLERYVVIVEGMADPSGYSFGSIPYTSYEAAVAAAERKPAGAACVIKIAVDPRDKFNGKVTSCGS